MRRATNNFQKTRTIRLSKRLFPIILLFLLKTPVTQAQTSVAFAGVDTLVDKAIELLYHQKYFEAIDICEDVIKKYPDNPMGYLGEAAVYHILMLNFRISLFDQKFDSLSTLAIKTGEQTIKKFKGDEKAYFVLGAAYGFRGLNRIRKGQWFGAFRDGLKGVSNLKKAHKLNKELYDVYYGLGLYYYWKSAKAKFLTFLRLMKDERDKGIEYLKIAVQKGRFASTEAVFALIEIYYYEDRYEEALQAALSLEDRFANDPTWNYLVAKIYGKLNRWQEAYTHFNRLLTLLEQSQFKSYSYLAECHYGIARSHFEQGNYEMARSELDLAFQLSRSRDKDKEIEGPLLDFDIVLERMSKLDEKLTRLAVNNAGKGSQ